MIPEEWGPLTLLTDSYVLPHCFSPSESESCSVVSDPMNYIVHGILQARILEWVVYPFPSKSSWPRSQTRVPCIAGRFFTSWAISPRMLSKKKESHIPSLRAWGTGLFLMAMSVILDCGLSPCFGTILHLIVCFFGWLVWEGEKMT